MRVAGCGLRGTGCGVRGAGCGVRVAGCAGCAFSNSVLLRSSSSSSSSSKNSNLSSIIDQFVDYGNEQRNHDANECEIEEEYEYEDEDDSSFVWSSPFKSEIQNLKSQIEKFVDKA